MSRYHEFFLKLAAIRQVEAETALAEETKRSCIIQISLLSWVINQINGREIPGPLMDFGVLMFHGGQIMAECDSGPYFYLSKLEAALEARLWDEIFTWTEGQLGLTFGTAR